MKRNYKIRRSGVSIGQDEKNIASNCNSITFSNAGDWPFYVAVQDQPFRFYLDRGMTISFGRDKSNVQESNFFTITFDVVNVGTVKECSVMRSYLSEVLEPNC